MTSIVNKLNLNKTPYLCEDNSLVCAKNIRLLKDGTIANDFNIKQLVSDNKYVNDILPDLNTKIASCDTNVNYINSTIAAKEAEKANLGTDDLKTEINNYYNNCDITDVDYPSGDDVVQLADLEGTDDWCVAFSEGTGAANNPKIEKKNIHNKNELLTYLNTINNRTESALLLALDVILSSRETYSVLLYDRVSLNINMWQRLLIDLSDTDDIYRKNVFTQITSDDKVFTLPDIQYDSENDYYYIEYYVMLYYCWFIYNFSKDINDIIINTLGYNASKIKQIEKEIQTLEQEKEEVLSKKADYNTLKDRLFIYNPILHSYAFRPFTLLKVIPYNDCFFLFMHLYSNDTSCILKYYEKENMFSVCDTAWHYSGTQSNPTIIDGTIYKNLYNDTLLTIIEYYEDNPTTFIPVKTINLSKSSVSDAEYIYTQTPNVPVTNILLNNIYNTKISPGVYQFFIRYEISKDIYTPWYCVSKPMFTASKKVTHTIQGVLTYVNNDEDSNTGFVLKVDIKNKTNYPYKRYQLGFLHCIDNNTVARSWKLFDISTTIIYFDNADSYLEEISTTDLLNPVFNIYNVKNVDLFNNKLYVSNYYETNYNTDVLKAYAKSIEISIATVAPENYNLEATGYNIQSLVPYQTYNFYVHLVNEKGEYTNGYLISRIYVDSSITTITTQNTTFSDCIKEHHILYPKFKFLENLPEDYVACFISIARSNDTNIELFNVATIEMSDSTADSIELDSAVELLNTFDIYDELGHRVTTGIYHPSFDTTTAQYFGDRGVITSISSLSTTEFNFIKIKKDFNSDTIKLHKCTPYITFTIRGTNTYTYNNYKDLNLLGYICDVTKLNIFDDIPNYTPSDYYIIGNDIYQRAIDWSGNVLQLKAFDDITDSTIKQNILKLKTANNKVFRIYSNYNLNFLSVTKDLEPTVISKKIDGTTAKPYTIIKVDSNHMNEIYDLKGTYYNYLDKIYAVYDENIKNKFNNSVRCSNTIGDEALNTTFVFYPDDAYIYHVPVSKGIIINLKSAGNTLLVHTEDSLFRFDANNTISAEDDSNISLAKTDLFNTGIKEVFASEYGFGGISKKEHSVVTELGYAFYDYDSNNMYLWNNTGAPTVITDSIKKLLEYSTIDEDNVRIVSDFYNDRLFVKIGFTNDVNILLSYNFKAKSFISIHDYNFEEAFNTKTKCYFINGNNIYTYTSDTTVNNLSASLYNGDGTLYPCFSETINSKTFPKPYVDIICNTSYELVKTLNAVSWICKQVNSFAKEDGTGETHIKYLNVAEENLVTYKGFGIQIYSNVTSTDIKEFSTTEESRTQQSILYDTLFNRTEPYYDLGRWNFNYFRNVLNNTDTTQSGSPSDNKSLIYGNYIVVRLIFNANVNFKLEDVSLNLDRSYEKRTY